MQEGYENITIFNQYLALPWITGGISYTLEYLAITVFVGNFCVINGV